METFALSVLQELIHFLGAQPNAPPVFQMQYVLVENKFTCRVGTGELTPTLLLCSGVFEKLLVSEVM